MGQNTKLRLLIFFGVLCFIVLATTSFYDGLQSLSNNLKKLSDVKESQQLELDICELYSSENDETLSDTRESLEASSGGGGVREFELVAQFSQRSGNFISDPNYSKSQERYALFFLDLANNCLNSSIEQRLDWVETSKWIARENGNNRYLKNLGVFYFQENIWPEALAIYKNLSNEEPTDPKILLHYGIILRAMNRHEEALIPLEKNIVLQEGDIIKTMILMGNSLYKLNELDRALELLNKAEQLTKSLEDEHLRLNQLYFFRGQIFEEMDFFDLAMSDYEKAAAYNSSNNQAVLGLVRLALKDGELDAAKIYIEQMPDDGPGSVLAWCLYEMINSLSYQWFMTSDREIEVTKMYGQCAENNP